MKEIRTSMRVGILWLVAIFLIIIAGFYRRLIDHTSKELMEVLHNNEVLIDYTEEDNVIYALVNRNGKNKYGDLFVVYERDSNSDLQRSYENDFKELKPWKLELADIDGDYKKEILIAVQKTTLFDKEDKNRMFIFQYEGGKLIKKWTGSQIAGNWRDFTTGNLLSIPGDELIFIERTEDKEEERISIYYWFDFGFFLIADSEAYPEIQNLTILGDRSIQITCKIEKEEVSIRLIVKDGKLVEEVFEP